MGIVLTKHRISPQVTKITSTGLTPFEAMLMRTPVLSFELNIGNQVVYKPDTKTYIEMTKKKLELTQRVIDLNMADANKISAKFYDRTAIDRTFKKVSAPGYMTRQPRRARRPN
jgi:hypothetical protein